MVEHLSKFAPIAERLAARSERRGECLIYVTGWSNARGHVRVGCDGRLQYVHRVAYRLANGSIPDGFDVLHSCDTPRCIEPKHLRIGTDADNVRDRVVRGRSAHLRGTLNGNAVLDEEKVRRMIAERAQGEILAVLGQRYGVSLQTVWRITRGLSWSHISKSA